MRLRTEPRRRETGFCGFLVATERTAHAQQQQALSSATSIRSIVWHGSQVASWHDGTSRIAVQFDGELFNAADLRCRLALEANSSNAEVVLAAWRRWSSGAMERLEGAFSLSVLDTDRLILYRDRSAHGDLFTSSPRRGEFAFATDLDALLNMPGVERRLSHRSLQEYLRFLDIAAPNTWFEGVQAIEVGQVVGWPDAQSLIPATDTHEVQQVAPREFSEAVDELNGHLRQSIVVRLTRSERPAAFLSGGIDSALICALAAKERSDLTAVTVGFSTAPYDESRIAGRIASHLGLTHEVLRFDQKDFVAAFERLVPALDQPMADPATLATVLAFEHCASRFDVVLDGTGADEAVGAMPARHVRLAVEYASRIPAGARLALARLIKCLPWLSGYAPILDFEHPADMMIRWKGFTRPEIEALCGEPVSFADTQFYRTFGRFDRDAHYERYSALLNAMPCHRLTQASRVTGMQPRYPFTDQHTDQFLRSLCAEFRHLPNEPKRILRALLSRYVPRDIWDAPKHGFDFPLTEFLVANKHAMVHRFLGIERWQQSGLLVPDRVADLRKRFIAGDHRLRFRVWALVVLAAWLEQHPSNIIH